MTVEKINDSRVYKPGGGGCEEKAAKGYGLCDPLDRAECGSGRKVLQNAFYIRIKKQVVDIDTDKQSRTYRPRRCSG